VKRIVWLAVFILFCSAGVCTSPLAAQTKSYGDIDVLMYSTNWCPQCRKAKEYLESLGVSLVVYDVDADKVKRAEMLEKGGGAQSVPLIDVEGILVRGNNQVAIKKAVEKKRNPE
jgi:glutaredoxin 3